VPGLATGRVVYLRLDPAIRSERGEALWVDEAWYTINALAAPADGRDAALAVEAGRSTPRAASAGHAAGATPEASAGHAAGATKPAASAPSRADGSGTRTDDAPLRVPLTPEQRAAGWKPLFDGRTFSGWRNYGGAEDAIEGWRIVDGALEFTRDVSFAGLAWNHLNPFGRPALDLMTKE